MREKCKNERADDMGSEARDFSITLSKDLSLTQGPVREREEGLPLRVATLLVVTSGHP